MTTGYSGTPLAKKLGIVEGATVAVIDEPGTFRKLLAHLPAAVRFRETLRGKPDAAILFVTSRAAFRRRLTSASRAIYPGGFIWVVWPKRASGVPTNMTEDVVREVALPAGLVDNKVCAIDATWSGLRIVWRVEHRSHASPPARV